MTSGFGNIGPSLIQFRWTTDKREVTLKAAIAFGMTGAPTLKMFVPSQGNNTPGAYATAPAAGTPSAQGIVRNSAGDYTLTLQGGYGRITGFRALWLNSKSLGQAAPNVRVVSDGTNTTADGGATVEFVCTKPVSANPTVSGLTAAGQVFSGTPAVLTGTNASSAVTGTAAAQTLTMNSYTPAGTNATSALTATAAAQTPNGVSGSVVSVAASITGTSTGSVFTVVSGGPTAASNAYVGMFFTDGVNDFLITANTALTSNSGTITVVGTPAAVVTATGAVYKTVNSTSAVTGTAAGQTFTGTPAVLTGTNSTSAVTGTAAAQTLTMNSYTPAGSNASSAVTGTLSAGAITETATDPGNGELLLIDIELSNSPTVV